jgi:hypothetical protein
MGDILKAARHGVPLPASQGDVAALASFWAALAAEAEAHMAPFRITTAPAFPGQHMLQSEHDPKTWLMGYCGMHGPAVFAAAPMVLAALKLARNNLRDDTNPATIDQIDAAIAAAERQV